MDLTLSQEQLALRQAVRRAMEERVRPLAAEIDEREEFPWEVVRLFAELELFALAVPTDYGGFDSALLTQIVALEEVARVCASSSMLLANQSLGAIPIIAAGSQAQKERYLPSIASGEMLASFALTEPGAGSDVRALTTTAEPVDGGYRLSGRKCFITQANVAGVLTVFARLKGVDGDPITAFLVDGGTPGLICEKVEHKMGIRGSPTCQILLEDVVVPADYLLGAPGGGFDVMRASLNKGRISTSAQALGIAQGALEAARDYANEREQFGRPIRAFQQIQALLADMQTDVEAARALVYAAAWRYDHKAPELTRFAAMAKLFATEMVNRVTGNALQILGGYGYTRDYPVERMLRDARIFAIFEGTNQIQRLEITRQMYKEIGVKA